ncbi:MAG: hypothetical protein V5A47_13680 [Bacteroidales bacterium]|nr:hypothetical protein [Bacteroidales bacterium]MBS3774487.1 hypothetical protein [Bacteroidales bacterium]
MKYYGLILLLFFLCTNIGRGAQNSLTDENKGHYAPNTISAESLPENYQLFKHQLIHLNKKQNNPPIFNFRRGTDFTMLYVAGGLLLATSTFVLVNGYNNEDGYFSQTNTGVIIGGSISTAVLITKFFLDQ